MKYFSMDWSMFFWMVGLCLVIMFTIAFPLIVILVIAIYIYFHYTDKKKRGEEERGDSVTRGEK